MPISWHQVIPNVMNNVEQLSPESILDIGIGFGKYGLLLRELLELPFERYDKDTWNIQIDGVEAFAEYKNPIHQFVYNHVFYDDISHLLDKLPSYDVILMIDVFEHFDKDTGTSLLHALIKKTKKAIIISTPQYPDPQEEYLGNKYEEHKSRWTNIDFHDFDFTSELVRVKENAAQIFVIYPPQEKTNEFAIDHIPSKLLAKENKILTIGYFLPHHNLTGGLKMLLEQMKHLRKNGHKIIVFYKGNKKDKVLPDWIDVTVDKEVLVPKNESYLSYLKECDIGIAGWVEQLPELVNANIPIVYWEQGNEWIFGELLSPEIRNYLQYCFSQPVAFASVSPFVSEAIKTRFNRKTRVIPNGIDTNFYYPVEPPNENIILLVGNPQLAFKGFDVAIRTLLRVWKAGQRFKVKWVCQNNPQLDDIPFPFSIEYIVNPAQVELAKVYRESDLFLFTSWYEGFGMPPLEAMASGVPVVTTRCGGIDVYAKNGVNAMMAEPGDISGLAEGLIKLLTNTKERQRLSKAGRETALKFSFPSVMEELEQYLIHLVKSQKSD